MLAGRTPETDMVDDGEMAEAQLLDRRFDQGPQIRHARRLGRGQDEVLHDGKAVMALRSFQVADEGHRKVTPFRIGEGRRMDRMNGYGSQTIGYALGSYRTTG
jgi:hypothetical protein